MSSQAQEWRLLYQVQRQAQSDILLYSILVFIELLSLTACFWKSKIRDFLEN
jgi:hypothetical protein